MTEDQQQRQSPKERKSSVHEIRNQDLVSRLLAATPPYLYSTPVGPNNFFFSDMLRSLVQARNNENARNIQLQQTTVIGRRPRKRSWSQHRPYYENVKERKDVEIKTPIEKPLELTHKQLFPISAKYSKSDHKDDVSLSTTQIKHSINNNETKISKDYEQNIQTDSSITTPTTAHVTSQDPSTTGSLPPSELVLPPPPPVWYPSLYPPYGIDPLHFFIDLRVSGHIYDRKKENISPLTNSDNNNMQNNDNNIETIGKHRYGSAFTVPVPRNDSKTISAINLSSTSSPASSTMSSSTIGNCDKLSNYNKYYDINNDTKENHPKNTNYVLQNLPRIYTNLTSHDSNDMIYETDNKSDQDIEEIDKVHNDKEANHIDVEILDNNNLKMKIGQQNRCQPIDHNQIHQID